MNELPIKIRITEAGIAEFFYPDLSKPLTAHVADASALIDWAEANGIEIIDP